MIGKAGGRGEAVALGELESALVLAVRAGEEGNELTNMFFDIIDIPDRKLHYQATEDEQK